MSAFLRTILGDDTELRVDSEHQPPDPIAKFLECVELRKNASPVLDESWNSPMDSPVDERIENECFEKAFLSAAAAMEKFIEKYGQRVWTERLPWEELRKSYRKERQLCRQ
jgi:hypothetical protein